MGLTGFYSRGHEILYITVSKGVRTGNKIRIIPLDIQLLQQLSVRYSVFYDILFRLFLNNESG